MPFWVLYVVVLITADTRDVAPEAVQSFAIGSIVQTLIEPLGGLWRRRVDPPTRRDEDVARPR